MLTIKYVISQNEVPCITNVKAIADTITRKINISYNVYDKEDTLVKITLRLLHGYKTVVSPGSSEISGEVGYPVKTGKRKSIVYHYNDSIININSYTIQLIADDLQQVNIDSLVAKVDVNNIRNNLHLIAKARYYSENAEQLEIIRNKIEFDFQKSGLQTKRQQVKDSIYQGENIIGFRQGLHQNTGSYILGAHMDAVKNTQGADDNASGIAGLLETMRVLSVYQFNHPICFVAFDLEELGLLGSKIFVAASDKQKIEGEINFDMISFYSVKANSQVFPRELKSLFPEAYQKISANGFKGDFILNTKNENSADIGNIFDSCASAYVPELKVVSIVVADDGKFAGETFRSSDHASFWDAGLKALSIGDTGDARNFNYHSAGDTIEKINFFFLQNVVKTTVATIAKLAGIVHATSANSLITF